ncbi:uncharacterized protein PAC_07336 [Phialocephala subalpina]|uniref:BTB domain-containing protein n=1 Tax=Phialocephala subalpina TaxID=576137 RepID=A0A1L7WXE8_9HELO|nr:uncharacterized protein PAC_07336 [Phialocephala subalpina]
MAKQETPSYPGSIEPKVTSEFSAKSGTEIADILVGSDLKHFKIHEKLLCAKSEFFEKMLHGRLKEAIEQTIRLPEDHAVAFDLFPEWLYSGNLYKADSNIRIMKDLMDCSMSSIITLCREHKKLPTTNIMVWAYQNKKPGSILRTFIAQVLLSVFHEGANPNGDWSLRELSNAISTNGDMGIDFLTILRAATTDDASKKLSTYPYRFYACRYHNHKTGEACPYEVEKAP